MTTLRFNIIITLILIIGLMSSCADNENTANLTIDDLWNHEMFDIQVRVQQINYTDWHGLDIGTYTGVIISSFFDPNDKSPKTLPDNTTLKINNVEVGLIHSYYKFSFLNPGFLYTEKVITPIILLPGETYLFELNVNGTILATNLNIVHQSTFSDTLFETSQNGTMVKWQLAENSRLQVLRNLHDPNNLSTLNINQNLSPNARSTTFKRNEHIVLTNINYTTAGKVVFISESVSIAGVKSNYRYVRSEGDTIVTPTKTELVNNYPNPFNPLTTIDYRIVNSSNILLEIFNPRGQIVETLLNGEFNAGYHKAEWNGHDLSSNQAPSGFYYYFMRAGDYLEMRCMMMCSW